MDNIISKEYADSSVARRLMYNKETKVLLIEYVSGTEFEYTDVPQSVVDEAFKAKSIGSFIHYNIKNKFSFKGPKS